MDILLREPEKLTPRLLFELYVHKDNLVRTLAVGIFSNMVNEVKTKLDKKAAKDAADPSLQKAKSFTLSTRFKNMNEREIQLKFKEFVEIINSLDEILLGDNSTNKHRRSWNDNVNLSKPVKDTTRELMMWALLSLREDKLEQIIENEDEPLKNYILAAVISKRCEPLCKKFGLNGLANRYLELADKYEDDAVKLLNRISRENGELALLLIRRKLPILGNRSMVDVSNFGNLQNLMASEPIQEMVTKMWYGGLEPEGRLGPLIAAWLLPPIAPFMLPPANDIHVDFDAPYFSWKTVLDEDAANLTTASDLTYWKKFVIFMTAPVTAFFYNLLIFFGFMGFFIWVIMRKFCLQPDWQEYVVVVTLVAICMERVRKFAAMRGITNRQRLSGLARDGFNTIFLFALIFMVFGVICRSVAYFNLPSEIRERFEVMTSDVERCPPMILKASIYTEHTTSMLGGTFELDLFVKWAHICYMISFFMMAAAALQFYSLNIYLGPLAISIGYMVKDFFNFVFLIIVFIIPYGVIMQSLLYPNELRPSKAQSVFFKPFMSLFGEMFKSETATYAFDSVDNCQESRQVILVPDDAVNRGGVTYLHWTTNKKEFKVEISDEAHPFYKLDWYQPDHLVDSTVSYELAVIGLLSLDAVTLRIKNLTEMGFIDPDVDLRDSQLRLWGLPEDYAEMFKEAPINTTTGQLFVPTEYAVFNKDFPRCPERYWVNSIWLILYMLFAVIMLVNLLVAMFATTYSNIQEKAEVIWKHQRYELVMEYYNNPAKPITPPLILLWDFYWIFKTIILKIAIKHSKANKEVLHPRVLGQHPMRLPPTYLPEESYSEIFDAISSLERQIQVELKAEEEPKYNEIEREIDQLRFRVQTLSKVTKMVGENAKNK